MARRRNNSAEPVQRANYICTDVSMFTLDSVADKIICSDFVSAEHVKALFSYDRVVELPFNINRQITDASDVFKVLLTHELCRKPVSAVHDVARLRVLHDFDTTQKGTLVDLQKKRDALETSMRTDPMAYAELSESIHERRQNMRVQLLTAILRDRQYFTASMGVSYAMADLALRVVLRHARVLLSGDNMYRSRPDDVESSRLPDSLDSAKQSGNFSITSEQVTIESWNTFASVLWSDFTDLIFEISSIPPLHSLEV